jgi:uncharacterized protein YbjT (DUF2867 family)
MSQPIKIVMLGASGAVGAFVLDTLLRQPKAQVTSLGRRILERRAISGPAFFDQEVVDVLDPASYREALAGNDTAICTLGVGQPSQMTREEFLRVDRDAVLDFARECKAAGVRHFSLLSAVGSDASSRFFYPRSKGQLEDGLRALQFERLSLIHPSMILTPTNRYGFLQGLTLLLWPWLSLAMLGPLRPYRGVRVEDLGRAMALDALQSGSGEKILTWDDFGSLNRAG